MKTTQGTFDIKTTPLETDNALKAMNAVRMLFEKRSFILQHSSFMNKGRDSQTIAVIPDSGTEELTGLRGHMKIEIKDGQHYYTFDYEV